MELIRFMLPVPMTSNVFTSKHTERNMGIVFKTGNKIWKNNYFNEK